MKYDYYTAVYTADDLSVFEFVSSGKHGQIRKQILFYPTDTRGIYNLALGDLSEKGELDDNVVSDNGDRNKILATIVRSIDLYTLRYPKRWIYFTGSSRERTRLYRMVIALNYEELSSKFEIFCRVDGEREFMKFQKDLPVSALLIKRKVRSGKAPKQPK